MIHDPANILIVDDEAIVRRVLGDALAQAGHRVQTAASDSEALGLLSAAPVDLLLLDLQLGDADGVRLMEISRGRWPQLPIIILTAHGSMSSAIAAVRHGAADYLLKPIGLDELRRRVCDVITRHRAGQQRHEQIRSMYQQIHALAQAEGLLAQAPPTPAAGPTYAAGPLQVDVPQHLVRMHGQPVEVTPTEFAILLALVQRPGAVITCGQIVQTFQGGQLDEDEARQVLRPHIVRLRRKIEPDPQHPHHLQSVRGIGYRWSSSGEAGEAEP